MMYAASMRVFPAVFTFPIVVEIASGSNGGSG